MGRDGDLARGNGKKLEGYESNIPERLGRADAAKTGPALAVLVRRRLLHVIGTAIVHRHIAVTNHVHGSLRLVQRHHVTYGSRRAERQNR